MAKGGAKKAAARARRNEANRLLAVDARGLPMPGLEVPSAFRMRRTAEGHAG